MYKIILASGSPRRKEILSQLGVRFEVITSDCDENTDEKNPAELVKKLSRLKAEAVAKSVEGVSLIIGADTVVAREDEIFGKPKDKEDARRMINAISGSEHSVYTGVCILINDGDTKVINFAEESKVHVADMSEDEIERYISTAEPYDKAGSYAVQGLFAPYISGIDGDYYNIVGLPVARVYKELKDAGIKLF